MVKVVVALGSNLGVRRRNLIRALDLVEREGVRVLRVSSFRAYPPAEGVAGGTFLNGVFLGETRLSAVGLLAALQRVESALGRPAGHAPGEARTIDLDIIYYGTSVIRRPGLRIPHPRRLKRPFVVDPLREVAPDFNDPVHHRPVRALPPPNETEQWPPR